MKLIDKYSLGLCPLHPNLPCFHHRPIDLYFNPDRPHVLIWAQAIKAGSATYDKVPLQSPMFKAALTIKHASKFELHSSMATTAVPPSPSTSTQGLMPTISPFTKCFTSTIPLDIPSDVRADAVASIHELWGWYVSSVLCSWPRDLHANGSLVMLITFLTTH